MTHSAAARHPFRRLALLLVPALAASVLSALAVPTDDAAEAASSITSFQPGDIITDADMFTYTTMSASAIQAFLDAKGSGCVAGSAPCLKDYRADVQAVAGYHADPTVRGCQDDIAAAPNRSAAQIIYLVAQACKINPQVLLVTLQKEQGLVTSPGGEGLTEGKYRRATGYNCSDSAPCAETTLGFFNQVYWAARAFQSYVRFPDGWNFRAGQVAEIQFKPHSACGTKTVRIANGATAALYNYTPYTPNGAALAAGVGAVGDGCSSYGNRNFWAYYYTWFGPVDDQAPYFIKNATTKQIYLIANGKRHPIASKHEMRLIAVATGIPYKLPSLDGDIVSQIGTGSFRLVEPGTVIAATAKSKKLYLVDGLTTKRPISKKQAIELTGSSKATVVGAKVVSGYRTGAGSAKLGLRVGQRYWIADQGVLRRIRPEDVPHYKRTFGFGTYDLSTVVALRTGISIGRLIRWDGHYYLVRDGRTVKISTAQYKRLAHQFGKKAQVVDDYFASLVKTKK
ncbi:hypothetical protein QT381_06870 [Galbitalea sp. SE-J8]|uniref:hypothetical protein n=1 Tax=Galbitalea sp. SE-J8 TaxID=3054952 RepID=UPI00259CBC79|nr:hypothetical protein [Galbitalea sp. SE-J8]MDM4762726.1 hypothetical protein [Galbitalea sp. SE-J8]